MGILDKLQKAYGEVSVYAKKALSKAGETAQDTVEKIDATLKQREERPLTPLEQLAQDWQTIYDRVHEASQESRWGPRMGYLKEAKIVLESIPQKYSPLPPEDVVDEQAYRSLLDYQRSTLEQLQLTLKTGQREQVQRLAVKLDEMATTFRPSLESEKKSDTPPLLEDPEIQEIELRLRDHGKKHGKKYAALGAFILYKIIRRG